MAADGGLPADKVICAGTCAMLPEATGCLPKSLKTTSSGRPKACSTVARVTCQLCCGAEVCAWVSEQWSGETHQSITSLITTCAHAHL